MRIPFHPSSLCGQAGSMCRVQRRGSLWLLPCNFENVAERVVVKAAHRCEVGRQCFATSLLKLLDEVLHVGGDYFFRRLPLRLLLLCPLSCIFCSCLPGRAFLFLTLSAARQKRLNGRQERTTTGTRRSSEWQARQVTNLFCGFWRAALLSRRDGPKRSEGYDEDRRKWREDARSASTSSERRRSSISTAWQASTLTIFGRGGSAVSSVRRVFH
jgi:hypothetical protein